MKIALLSALAAASLAGAAFAQTTPAAGGGQGPTPEMMAARQAMRQACAADAQSLCPGQRGRERMMCMRGNADKLSQGCKDAMAKMPHRRGPAGGGAPGGR